MQHYDALPESPATTRARGASGSASSLLKAHELSRLANGTKGISSQNANSDDAYLPPGVDKWSVEGMKLRVLQHQVLIFWSLAATASNVGMVVSLVKLGLKIPNFSYFVLNGGCLFFNVPFFTYAYVNDFFNHTITPEMTGWRLKGHMFLIGGLVAVNGLLVVFSNPHVPGPLQTLLLQTSIPVVMLFSKFFVGSSYNVLQYLSAFLVVGGVVFSLIPNFEEGGDQFFKGELLWIVCFFLGNVPNVLSTIYQEWAFRSSEVDIGYLMAWSNLGQFIFLIFLAPLNAVHGFGEVDAVSEVWQHYKYGLQCLGGHDVPMTSEGACRLMFVDFVFFIFFYTTANFSNAALVKHGNATFSILVSIASTILADICFSMKLIMGSNASSFNGYDIGALLIVLLGATLFRVYSDGSDTGKVTPAVDETSALRHAVLFSKSDSSHRVLYDETLV